MTLLVAMAMASAGGRGRERSVHDDDISIPFDLDNDDVDDHDLLLVIYNCNHVDVISKQQCHLLSTCVGASKHMASGPAASKPFSGSIWLDSLDSAQNDPLASP